MTIISDLVATAIVAACRETGADPEQVAMGVTNRGGPKGDLATPRARAYAAMALRPVLHPDFFLQPEISRMVGAKLPSTYMSGLDFSVKTGKFKWWDDAVFMRVLSAVEAAPKPNRALKADPIRPVRRPLGALANDSMGDPEPGRSALAQKLARQAPRDGE